MPLQRPLGLWMLPLPSIMDAESPTHKRGGFKCSFPIGQEAIQILKCFRTLEICNLNTRNHEDDDGIQEYPGKLYGMK